MDKSRSYFRNRKIAPESQWVFASGCCCGAVRREGAEQSRSLPKFVYFDLSLVVVSSMSSIASRYTYLGYTISSHSLDCLIQGPLSSFSSSRRCSAPHNLVYNQVTLESLEQLLKVVSCTNSAQRDCRTLKPSVPKIIQRTSLLLNFKTPFVSHYNVPTHSPRLDPPHRLHPRSIQHIHFPRNLARIHRYPRHPVIPYLLGRLDVYEHYE